jgi:hypothetical protein
MFVGAVIGGSLGIVAGHTQDLITRWITVFPEPRIKGGPSRSVLALPPILGPVAIYVVNG